MQMEVAPALRASRPRLARRSIQLGLVATLVALLPLVLLARLATSHAQHAVRDEVGVRLRVTTAMSTRLLAEQLGAFVGLAEAEARHPRLVRAVAGAAPARFDNAETRLELAALAASRAGVAGAGLADLDGVLRAAPGSPELVGKDFSARDWYRGLVAAGDTYVSEAFESAQATHPLVVSVSTYVRAPRPGGRTPGAPRAILVMGVRLDAVQPLADSVAAVQGVHLWVADQRGKLLAAPGGRQPGLTAVADEPIGRAASLRPGQLAEVDLGGEPTFVVRQRVDPLGWTVFAALPRAVAFGGVEAIRTTMLTIAIPLGLLVCGGIVLFLQLQRRQWRVEAALEAAGDQARDASRLKTEFLSRVSHELRTPLNAILGFGQLLQLDDDLGDEQRESVDQILRGGRHLLGLINEVLDISRIETGNLALSSEAVDLFEVVSEAVDLIRPLAAEREIHLRSPSREDCPFTVEADRQRLRQVLLNLASNAVKYNHHGGSIRLACHATLPGRVAISVQDTGPGVPEDKLQRLFVPFDRLGAEQTDVQGTGMGLALSKGLMDAMGGTLTVHSVQGRGTTFTLELAETQEALVHSHASVPTPPTPRQDLGAHPGQTVLYAEDNPSNLRLVERVLGERGGVRLLAAPRGEVVQGLARQHRPDLVLLDLHLPDLDGEEVLRRLQADPRTTGLPVVVVSADVTPGQVERLLAAGATEYLTKPLDVPRFLEVVERVLQGARR